ncbi:protein of unknown function [Maridesulfovibrio hydrothermalis AM13 = DSM 14728]|uniref:Uncharacterized protein n=1 Tax=Maridesulfovibrio hydrothermalis AM13 = DSM 14728 TaxID=1121451 RepID=L0R950_9BACT|nr:protein of unknown function [Maridesulfovibrio hydrothermalis AM13 = DSM 14728]
MSRIKSKKALAEKSEPFYILVKNWTSQIAQEVVSVVKYLQSFN